MEKLGKRLKAHREELEVEIEEVESSGGEGSIQDFVTDNRKLLLGGLILLALLIMGAFAWNIYQKNRNVKANAEMFQAVRLFEANRHYEALNGDSLGAKGMLYIVDQYGSTPAGNMARYYAGVSQLNLGEADNAIANLEKFSYGKNSLSVSAYAALGFAYQEKEMYEKSAQAFEKGATALGENEHTTPFMLFQAGRTYEMGGNTDKALRLYKRIQKDYPKSTEGLQMDKYIAKLSP